MKVTAASTLENSANVRKNVPTPEKGLRNAAENWARRKMIGKERKVMNSTSRKVKISANTLRRAKRVSVVWAAPQSVIQLTGWVFQTELQLS